MTSGEAETLDLAIVGGGPAGLAALAMAADCGLRCLLIEESEALGGRVLHGLDRTDDTGMPHPEAGWGRPLIAQARNAPGAAILSGHSLVDITPPEIAPIGLQLVRNGKIGTRTARRLLLATGSTERPIAVPGWTRPGVMTAGGVQTLMKGAAIVPEGKVVLAGTGPLLLLLAAQLHRAGVRIAALLDTTPRRHLLAAAPLLPGALLWGSATWRGLGLLAALRRARIPTFRAVRDLSVDSAGTDKSSDAIHRVTFSHGGRRRSIDCALLIVHFGVVPDTEAARLAGCRVHWAEDLPGWAPVVDRHGNSTRADTLIAGDAAGIDGAEAARHSGRIAAAEAAVQLGKLSSPRRDALIAADRLRLTRLRRERAFLNRLFFPPDSLRRRPDDSVIICRCEEVTAGALRHLAAAGVHHIGRMKALTRCGMGTCQGRICGTPAAEIIAETTGLAMQTVGALGVRPPLKPLPIAALATQDETATPPDETRFVYSRDS